MHSSLFNCKYKPISNGLPSLQISSRYVDTQVKETSQLLNSDRIIDLVNQTRQKLKLINNTPDARFNRQLQQFRVLDTFIDTKSKLKRMNILNNRDLLESVKAYLIRRKIQRQFGEEEIEVEKIYEQFEVKLDKEFDQVFLDSDYFLDIGLLNQRVQEQKRQPKIIEKIYGQKLQQSNPGLNIQFTSQNNSMKSQYDDNLFYQQIESHIDKKFKEKEESEQFMNKLGKKFINQQKPPLNQQDPLRKRVTLMEQKISQIDFDRELLKIVLEYGIDLNSTEQLEEEIYLAFKQKAKDFIRQQINEAKHKHNQHIEEDKIKLRLSQKPRKLRVSSMFEQQFFHCHKQEYSQKPNSELGSKKITTQSENKKSSRIFDKLEKQKQNAKQINEFHRQSLLITDMCKVDEQKIEQNDFIKDIQVMNSYVDEAISRTNFQRKLSELGFSQEDQFLVKKSLTKQRRQTQISQFQENI